MKNTVLPVLLGAAISVSASADTAFFDGDIIHVPQLLVFHEETPQLLQQVGLEMTEPGTFELVYASEFNYTSVQGISTDSEILRGDPLIIQISGLKSVECVKLNPVSVSRLGQAIHLVVTEQPVPENVRCMAGSHSFLVGVTLDTAELEPGHYDIYVHGLRIEVQINGEAD